jgi:uncharacterized protein with PIN domain
VKFWDSSGIVPLLLDEPSRDDLLELLGKDPEMLVWWGTPVECTSAVARREREGDLSVAQATDALSLERAVDRFVNILRLCLITKFVLT